MLKVFNATAGNHLTCKLDKQDDNCNVFPFARLYFDLLGVYRLRLELEKQLISSANQELPLYTRLSMETNEECLNTSIPHSWKHKLQFKSVCT